VRFARDWIPNLPSCRIPETGRSAAAAGPLTASALRGATGAAGVRPALVAPRLVGPRGTIASADRVEQRSRERGGARQGWGARPGPAGALSVAHIGEASCLLPTQIVESAGPRPSRAPVEVPWLSPLPEDALRPRGGGTAEIGEDRARGAGQPNIPMAPHEPACRPANSIAESPSVQRRGNRSRGSLSWSIHNDRRVRAPVTPGVVDCVDEAGCPDVARHVGDRAPDAVGPGADRSRPVGWDAIRR
jgi:hypothetical protein